MRPAGAGPGPPALEHRGHFVLQNDAVWGVCVRVCVFPLLKFKNSSFSSSCQKRRRRRRKKRVCNNFSAGRRSRTANAKRIFSKAVRVSRSRRVTGNQRMTLCNFQGLCLLAGSPTVVTFSTKVWSLLPARHSVLYFFLARAKSSSEKLPTVSLLIAREQ